MHAIWTDERISASCVSMRNTDHLRENADAARRFEPLKTADIHQLRDAILAQGPTMCADCDGRCMTAAGTTGRARQHHPVPDVPPAVTATARTPAASTPKLSEEARDWSGADLEAARAGVPEPAQLRPPPEPRPRGTSPENASMIRLNRGIVIDERELEFEFIRSSGPGRPERQQGVDGRPAPIRCPRLELAAGRRARRLIRLAGKRFGDDGFLTIHARAGRTQESNRRDAIERLVELIEKAAVRPTPRRATKPTRASRERRLDTKRRRGETKQARRTREPGDD